MRRINWSLLAYASVVLAGAAFGETPASAPSTPNPGAAALVQLTPAFNDAVANLTGGSFKGRQAAIRQVEQAFAEVSGALVTDQTMQSPAQATEALRLNAGLSLWLEAALTKAPANGSGEIRWGLMPEHVPLVSRAYSTRAGDRVQAAHKLAELDDPQARLVLAGLLWDLDRDVHLAAMDALWDAPATKEAVEALWDRGITQSTQQYHPPAGVPVVAHLNLMALANVPPPLKFRGQVIRRGSFDNSDVLRGLDGDVAIRMLLHYNSPVVAEKIGAVLARAAAEPEQNLSRRLFQQFQMSPNFLSLFSVYKDKAIVGLLYRVATAELPKPPVGAPANNVLFTSRVGAIATIVTITSQDPEVYRLKKSPQYPDTYVVNGDADEAFAVEKLKAWWAEHGADYSVAEGAATRPSGS